MKRKLLLMCVFVVLASLAAHLPPVGGPLPGRGAAETSGGQMHAEFDADQVMGLIYEGYPDSAMAVISRYERALGDDPLLLLVKTRVQREWLSDEDENKTMLRRDIEPMLATLDRVIQNCDKALGGSSPDLNFLFYRGWAWMSKAQLHTLVRSYWSAGRSAGRGKSDLEDFLKKVPDSGDAHGMLGAFLYFADTLPGVLKFLGKLFFIPTGDRDKGLEMLEYGASHPGVFQTDYRIALAAIWLAFEGDFEKGSTEFLELIEEFPHYLRLVEPLSVVGPLYPTRMREFEHIEDLAISRHIERRGKDADWNLVQRLKYRRIYADMFFRSPGGAERAFTLFEDGMPPRPDWLRPLVIVNRAALYATFGDPVGAQKEFEFVLTQKDMNHFHDVTGKLLKSLQAQQWPQYDPDELEFIGLIYDEGSTGADEALERYRASRGEDVIYYFYLGDNKLLSYDLQSAAAAYEAVLQRDAVGWLQNYQMFAAIRLAEIAGHNKLYRKAKDHLQRAVKYHHVEYLLDMLIHERIHYYDLQLSGKITAPPSMLAPVSRGHLDSVGFPTRL